MRVLVCGDRNWGRRVDEKGKLDEVANRRERDLMWAAIYNLNEWPEQTVVIHGAAAGADSLAATYAAGWGMVVQPYPANWGRYGKAAGPVRNAQMLREGKPDKVLAFHNDLSKSKGTLDMVTRAQAAGIPVQVISV